MATISFYYFKYNFKNLDRGTDSVIRLGLIKGSNLSLKICVCKSSDYSVA